MPEYLLLEDGTSRIILEDASGLLLLEESGVTPTPPGVATWTFMLTDIASGTELADITSAALTARISPRLNRPLEVTLELPADNADIRAIAADGDPNLTVGTRSIKAYRNDVLRANVIVWNLSYDGDADQAKVAVTGYDPMIQLRRRPARDDTGDFSNPEFGDATPAGALVQGVVENSTVWGEGGLLMDHDAGSFTAAATLGGNLGDWPVMIFDLFSIFTDTGKVDIVMEPLDSTAGKLGVLNAVNIWGTDKTASVNFDYATGDHSVAKASRVVDMDDIANKLWYYLGPKIDVQHWRGNIVGTDPDSVLKYGIYMDIRIFDSGQENAARDLFIKLRAAELAHRRNPLELLSVTPQAGVAPEPFDDYDIGDTVTVNLGTAFGPAMVGGVQRIYGFDCDIDTDGVERVSELMVSAQGFNPPDVPGDPVDPDDPGDGISKPVYHKTDQTRLAGLERKARFLERREQIPKDHGDIVPYSISGDLTVDDGGLRWYTLKGGTIQNIFASVGTAPTGSGVTVRVNKNGTSLGTVTIAAGDHTNSFEPASPDYDADDYFTVDVTAIGSTTPGSDLVVEIRT